jgi:hypothetical protein
VDCIVIPSSVAELLLFTFEGQRPLRESVVAEGNIAAGQFELVSAVSYMCLPRPLKPARTLHDGTEDDPEDVSQYRDDVDDRIRL